MRDALFFCKLRVFLGAWRWRHHRRSSWLKARLRRARRRLAHYRSRLSTAAPSRLVSPFTLEPLEARVLLAADLTGLVTAHTLADPNVPTNSEAATVQVVNQGNTATNAVSQVAVYASLDSTLDTSDVLLGTANAPKTINAGGSANVNVSLAMPSTLQAGGYKLLVRVDATNTISENNEANNLSVGPTFNVAWQFGAVPGLAGSTTLQLTDADGTLVTFKISAGPGTGMVIKDGTKWDVRVTGTDATSVVTINANASGNGRVSIDDLFVGGPLKALNADKVDLTGTFAVLGSLGDATLGSMNGGTIAATTVTGTLQVKGNVQNATILIGANLGQDGKLGGTATDTDTFGAGSLSKLNIIGNLTNSTVRIGVNPVDGIFGNGDDVILGGTSSNLGSLSIGGTMTGSHFFAGST